MTLTAGMLREDALRTRNDGFEVDIHLPWYRSLQLSCVEDVGLRLGGGAVPPGDIRFVLDGAAWELGELADQFERFWFVQDPVTLRVAAPAPPVPGETVAVAVRLDMRIPYIIVGPQRALVTSSRVERELVAR